MSPNQERGCLRDRNICSLIEARQALDTEQVRVIVFPGMKCGRRKAQERLKALHDRGRLNRWRPGPESPYIYYVGKKHGRIEHLVALNWVYVWMVKSVKSWEEITRWDYEQDYGILQADAFCMVRNTVTNKLRMWFVELDRAESGNLFDKVRKYNDLYRDEKYSGWWWADIADRFPGVLVVTTAAARERTIRGLVEKQNGEGLEFQIYLLENLKEACIR
ncbi:MAG: replication-relaxation family protein [Firmicutes bacterium]|nr:replication-relaxation family protein [Bacillota bacterium]